MTNPYGRHYEEDFYLQNDDSNSATTGVRTQLRHLGKMFDKVEQKTTVDTSNYSPQRLEAYNLMQETGVQGFSGRRFGAGKEPFPAHSLDEVAEENLPLVIADLKRIQKRLEAGNNQDTPIEVYQSSIPKKSIIVNDAHFPEGTSLETKTEILNECAKIIIEDNNRARVKTGDKN
jgi:hypothetical protein